MLVRLGHHRRGQHGEDGAACERQDEGQQLRRRAVEQREAEAGGGGAGQGDARPERDDGRDAPPGGSEPGRRREGELESRLRYRSFAEFIEAWVWKCGFLDRYADFESLAESVLRGLAEIGVVHVEPTFSPGDYERNGLEMAGLVEAVLGGAGRAAAATGVSWGLIVDLIRDHGPATAARRLDAVTPYRRDGVVAVGLGGSEAAHPPRLFAEVYGEARRSAEDSLRRLDLEVSGLSFWLSTVTRDESNNRDPLGEAAGSSRRTP